MIYRKSKPKNIFFTAKSDLYKFIQKESNETTLKEQKNVRIAWFRSICGLWTYSLLYCEWEYHHSKV